jgi:spore coat protein U-like protein
MKRILGLAALLLFGWLTPALGQSCSVTSNTIVFGTYTGAQVNVSSGGTVICTNGISYNITASAGTSIGATTTTRKMTGPGGATLAYKLCRDSACALNWGNTINTDTIRGTGNGFVQPISYYGILAAGQTPTPGSYTDTISLLAIPRTGTSNSNSFTVMATVAKACTVSATNLNFGTYAGALVSVASTVTANCTNTTPYNIGFNAGTSTGATVTTRKMTGPGGLTLTYGLFRDAAYTLNWGNTVGIDTKAGTGNGGAQALTVYGRMPAGPFVNPGVYSDTIIATLTY